MIKVGLTGGIGSGKTLISEVFSHLGIPVFNADDEVKKMYDTNIDVIEDIRKAFGNEVFSENRIDRKKLSALVFSNSEALTTLNSIAHTALKLELSKWFSAHSSAPYAIVEAAILFESGFNALVDKVIVVVAPKELRIQRVMQRDKTTADKVLERMQHQLSQEELMANADYTIFNDGETPLLPQVLYIHNQLIGNEVR